MTRTMIRTETTTSLTQGLVLEHDLDIRLGAGLSLLQEKVHKLN